MKSRVELRIAIHNYVMEDDHRLEIFTDHEICTEEDYAECVEELDVLLSDMSTEDMATIVDNIEHDDEFDTYYDVFYGNREDKDSLTVYLDDITGTLGKWLDMEFDYEVPREAIKRLQEAYQLCAEALEK